MPNFVIHSCQQAEFDSLDFPKPGLKEWNRPEHFVAIEGKVTAISYRQKDGTPPATSLQIMRNFQNAAKAAGGEVFGEWGPSTWGESMNRYLLDSPGGMSYDKFTLLHFTKGGQEYWVNVGASQDYHDYTLVFVQREAMKQNIVANDWLEKLGKNGFVAIYITFDTGQAIIKPESQQTIADMADMLKKNAAMKVEVSGHTDNVGNADANLKLSDARAQAVMKALVAKGVAATQLTAKGYGQTVPIADNRLEEGRALNRRVELMKK